MKFIGIFKGRDPQMKYFNSEKEFKDFFDLNGKLPETGTADQVDQHLIRWAILIELETGSIVVQLGRATGFDWSKYHLEKYHD